MLQELKRSKKNKKPKLVGRGGSRGKTSGRGTKGQKARAGHKIRPQLRDIIKKLPKLRGRGKNVNKAFRAVAFTVSLASIESVFDNGAVIRRETLIEKGLVKRQNGKIPAIKILATGDVTKKFSFFDVTVSAGAKQKIEKAGGIVRS